MTCDCVLKTRELQCTTNFEHLQINASRKYLENQILTNEQKWYQAEPITRHLHVFLIKMVRI